MNKEKQNYDSLKIIADQVKKELRSKFTTHEKRLPYESIEWKNGAWSVKTWKQVPSLPT